MGGAGGGGDDLEAGAGGDPGSGPTRQWDVRGTHPTAGGSGEERRRGGRWEGRGQGEEVVVVEEEEEEVGEEEEVVVVVVEGDEAPQPLASPSAGVRYMWTK